jgi:formylglycine-generating enzyme required for sulfatase activity
MVLTTPDASVPVTIVGSDAYASGSGSDEKGVFINGRTVTLSPFKIAKYETTYELWYEVKTWAGTHGYTFANAGQEGHDGTAGAAPTGNAKMEPVTEINWRDAIIWCNAYSEMSGKEPVYYTDTSYGTVLIVSTNDGEFSTVADLAVMKPGADGYRLPTEAEWEYAARGGGTPATNGPFVYTYAGSGTIGNVAWYVDNANSSTHPVGEKAANTAGLYDMSGNVSEWCWDWYGTVSTGIETDPTGPAPNWGRVQRGGRYVFSATRCTVAYRDGANPNAKAYFFGFRVVSQ